MARPSPTTGVLESTAVGVHIRGLASSLGNQTVPFHSELTEFVQTQLSAFEPRSSAKDEQMKWQLVHLNVDMSNFQNESTQLQQRLFRDLVFSLSRLLIQVFNIQLNANQLRWFCMDGRDRVAKTSVTVCSRYTLELLVLKGVFKTADF